MRILLIIFSASFQSACGNVNKPSEATLHNSIDENVYAFIGRKVSTVQDIPMETIVETIMKDGVELKVERKVIARMDYHMVATYEVTHPFSQGLDFETITFTAYDHFGFFNFANYKYALLLVGKYEDEYFLHKYQHDSVFKTHEGRWAACGESPIDTTIYNIPQIKSVNIEFSPKVRFGPNDSPPINRGFMNETNELEAYWNSTAFEIIGENAICKRGIYAEDFFELRMNTVMKARAKTD